MIRGIQTPEEIG